MSALEPPSEDSNAGARIFADTGEFTGGQSTESLVISNLKVGDACRATCGTQICKEQLNVVGVVFHSDHSRQMHLAHNCLNIQTELTLFN